MVTVELGDKRQLPGAPHVEEGNPGEVHKRRPSEFHHAAESLPKILQVVLVELPPELD
jgi:hypothetical protein